MEKMKEASGVRMGRGQRHMPAAGRKPQRRPALTHGHTAYEAIKRRIIRVDLAPGTTFTAGEVAASMGLSKTPIREALVRLQREGLVEVVSRSGYLVTPVTLKYAKDLFALRILLEGETARLAAQNTTDPHQLRVLDDLCGASYDITDPNSIDAFNQANTAFHCTIARLSGNAELAAVLEQVLHKLERLFNVGLRLQSRPGEIVHEHQQLVKALAARDSEQAMKIAVTQGMTSQRMVLDALLSSPALLLVNVPVGAGVDSHPIDHL